MPDIDSTVVDGEAGHTLHHVDLATEVNSLRARVLAAENKNAAQDTALAGTATKPAQGFTIADLDPFVLAGTRITYLWNGTGYEGPGGVIATAANSTAAARQAARYGGTFRDYLSDSSGPDPRALNLTVNGDAWESVA